MLVAKTKPPPPGYPYGSPEGGPFPYVQGGYGVILVDPPWNFAIRSPAGATKCPSMHYQTEDLDWIAGLRVSALAADDCALFMWATWPMLPQALQVISAWGFEYSALAWEWLKYNDATGKFTFGTGYTTRKNVEPCLLAMRGSPKVQDKSMRDMLFARRRENGRKPDSQYARCERLFKGPYLELFSRTTCPGWSVWGKDINTWTLSDKPPMDEMPDFMARKK